MAKENYLLQIAVQVKNDKAITQLTTNLEKASKAAPRMRKNIKETARATRNYGNVAQNAGYQIQDMIVQISGGVDPLRAMGQQLPQMAVGFGAIGAAVGVAAAALPAIVALFRETTEEAKDSTEALADLEGAISSLGRTYKTIDLTAFIDQFNAADAAGQALLQTMLDLDLRQAGRELRAAGQALQEAYDEMTDAGIFRTARPTETFGITAEQAGHLAEALRRLQEANPDMDLLNANIAVLTENLDGTSAGYQKLVDDIIRAKFAYEGLTQAASKAQEAADGGVLSGGTPEKETAIGKAAEDTEALWRAMHELGKELPGVVEDIEAFSLAQEAIDLFGRTFDTMLDGVIRGTTDLEDGIKNMVKVILIELGKLAAYQFIANTFAGSALGNAAGSLIPSAQGNVMHGGNVVPFARGGVVSTPTIFPMAKGAGLMGEAGPEAIMPLKRTATGDLGVQGGGMNVTINNTAGVDVVPRQDESGLTIDIIERGIANAIRSGGNGVSSALEDTFSLSRGQGVY